MSDNVSDNKIYGSESWLVAVSQSVSKGGGGEDEKQYFSGKVWGWLMLNEREWDRERKAPYFSILLNEISLGF